MTDVPPLPHPKSMSSDHQASAVGRASLGLEQLGGPRAGGPALGSGEVAVEAGGLWEWGQGRATPPLGSPVGGFIRRCGGEETHVRSGSLCEGGPGPKNNNGKNQRAVPWRQSREDEGSGHSDGLGRVWATEGRCPACLPWLPLRSVGKSVLGTQRSANTSGPLGPSTPEPGWPIRQPSV